MRSNKTKKNQIRTLRDKHFCIICIMIAGVIMMEFTDNWGSYTGIAFPLAAIILDGKYETEDELVKQNLARSNSIVMWFLLAALIVLAGYDRWQDLSYTVYLCIVCAALALRSILFLLFDRTPRTDTEE